VHRRLAAATIGQLKWIFNVCPTPGIEAPGSNLTLHRKLIIAAEALIIKPSSRLQKNLKERAFKRHRETRRDGTGEDA
jgi:hypothetical protein